MWKVTIRQNYSDIKLSGLCTKNVKDLLDAVQPFISIGTELVLERVDDGQKNDAER